MHEGERQHQARLAAALQRAALRAAPAEPGRGIDQVADEGHDALVAVGPQPPVHPVDGGVVEVEGDDAVGVLGRDPRVGTVVGAEVPGQRGARRRRDLAYELRLGGVVGIAVGVLLAVLAPGGPPGLPVEALDELAQALAELERISSVENFAFFISPLTSLPARSALEASSRECRRTWLITPLLSLLPFISAAICAGGMPSIEPRSKGWKSTPL